VSTAPHENGWQPAVYVTLVFDRDETRLRPNHERAVDLIAATLGERLDIALALTAPGRAKQSTARARLANVRAYLVARGVFPMRLREMLRDEHYPAGAPILDDRVEFWAVERSGRKLEPIEPLSVDAAPAGDLDTDRSAVVYVFDQRRPGNEAARMWLERAERECHACNGVFGPQGSLGAPGCACRTRDAGTPCSTSSECEYRCQLPWGDALRLRHLRCRGGRCVDRGGAAVSATIPRGRCAELVTPFGCQGWIVDVPSSDGPTREVDTLCMD
jgi:hypothetical protein